MSLFGDLRLRLGTLVPQGSTTRTINIGGFRLPVVTPNPTPSTGNPPRTVPIGGFGLLVPDPRTVAPSDIRELTVARDTPSQGVPPSLYDDESQDLISKKLIKDPNALLPPGRYELHYTIQGDLTATATQSMLAASLKASVPGYVSHRIVGSDLVVVIAG